MVLISLYYVLLYKLSGQGDIIVGAPTAGRRHVEVNKIIGMFLNTLAIRNYPEGKKTFKTFLQEVKTRVTEAFENQDYQFEDLVERLKVRRDTSRNPLFDTMFLLQNQEEFELDIPGLKLKPFDYQENSSKFDLSLYASESDQRIICVINYSTKLFKQATIEIVGQYLKNIQSAVLKNPSCQISDIEILSMEKKTLLLAQFNQGLEEEVKPMMADNKVFQDKLEESLFKFKDNAAIEYGENTITYAQLDSRSDDAANWLLARGIRRETFIGILIEDRLELINIIVGIIKAGSVFIPLDSSYPDSRLKLMMKCSGMEMIISDETNYNRFTGAEADDFVLLDELFSKQKPARLVKTPEIQYYPEDKIYIYFTSGTTGTPKAVPGKNSGLLHFISWELERFHIRSGFRASQLIIPCFDPYLRDIFVPFCSGGVICIPGSREILLNATRLIRWLDAQDIHLIHCVPGHFRLMNSAALTGNNFKNLKFILLSGEKINPPDLVDWYETFGERIQIVNLYGPTETTLAKLHYLIDKDDINRLRIPIGTPIKGSRVIILDENFNLCGPLVKGEICIRTPFRSHGYYNDPGLNRKKFIQNPFNDDPADILYRSGDLGMVLADGNIDILGRIDRQVKLRGMRIELEEIESVLIKYPAVKEAVVVKKELSTNNEFLCAYVTEKNEHQLDKSMLNKYLAGKLPGNMVPSVIIQIEEITRNPNGKIDYKKLPDPTAEAKGLGREPKNHIEEKLLDLWSGILGRDKANINVTIGFFEAGGNSLNIMALVSKIHREFDIKIPLNEIFKNSTIESQAAIIMEAKKDKYIRFEPAEKKECYELSSAQKRMYVAQQMELGGKSYNIHNTVRLIGLLDRKRLEDTFLKLIQRHDILRTSFIMHHYRPVQKIYDAVDFEIEYFEAVENEVPEIIDHFIRVFDLSSPPLLRVGLVKTGENRHVMLVDMYHIISDAVSIGVLIKDFTAQYKGEALPPLKIQYKDFVQWQYRLYKSGAIKKQEEYWLNVLKGELPVLNLPTDYPRPRVRSVEEGDLITFTLGRELTGKLFQVGKETNTTLFMLLLAVYFVFLFKYTGQEDIIVGSPITGRLHEDWQNVIGVFVNMLAMRNQLQEEKTFITLLEEVKRNALAAFENQDYQFEELVNHLRLQGKSNRNPLFDTEFAVHNMEMPPLEIPGLEFQPYESTIKFAKFDLHFTAEENNDNIDITLRYYTALFKKSTIDKMAEHFVEIVRQVVENLEIKLEDITISIDLLAVTTNILEEAKGDFEF
jgi:amino acid adenylation domain-containing protein